MGTKPILSGVLAIIGIIIISGCSQLPRQPSQDNSQSASSEQGRPPTTSKECPSQYDGTYQGIFAYMYDIPIKDENGRPIPFEYRTETSGIRLSVTLECRDVSDTGFYLEVTHVTASHPDFGCQVGGCDVRTPKDKPWLNLAYLPLEGTTATRPSLESMGIYINFPNGMEIVTNGFAGSLYVSMDGQVLSNSLEPSIQGSTYSVMNSLAVTADDFYFPSEAFEQDGRINPQGFKSWKISKTT